MVKKNLNSKNSYISLFSGAGIGCYGFKLEGYDCISTVEILEKRLNIQKYNNKCVDDDGYICGDIRDKEIKKKLLDNIRKYLANNKLQDLDVLIATPPCQGMSVANHKKGDEKGRNSLVVESIKLIKEIKPKFFIFENVSAFLKTICTDLDGNDKEIGEAIDVNLSGEYNFFGKVVNFKNYGSNSSRTRTLVIGVRKDQKNITPIDLFPDYSEEKTLYEVIGDLQSLKVMGEISNQDIYHQFRPYSESMRDWIKDLKEGESAFDNKDPKKRPHKLIDGEIVQNQNKNADKYTRQFYNKVAPCIHTRNDILASQNTVHPVDDRVFSVRELMRMMTIPESFNWTNKNLKELNSLPLEEKRAFLKKEELNIRHSIGEAVPTNIFKQIAHKIKEKLDEKSISIKEIENIISEYKLSEILNLKNFVKKNPLKLSYNTLLVISELSNSNRIENAAYYTSQDIVFNIVKYLPSPKLFKKLSILEPSVGIGAFLPILIKKYEDVEDVEIDVIDVDDDSLEILKILLKKLNIPENVRINIISGDFLKYKTVKEYDIVIGNPPYGKVTDKKLLFEYQENFKNNETNNIFSFFIEKAISCGNFVSLIVPKSLLNAPEFAITRKLIGDRYLESIIDFGEKGFKGVKIETINIMLNSKKKGNNNGVIIDSYITNLVEKKAQEYITDNSYPYWLIYRDAFFDDIAQKLKFDIFKSYRDRQITKRHTKSTGKYRVLKSRNIISNGILDIPGYDSYIDDIESFSVKKFLNCKGAVLVPNLTYYPRACFMPQNCITDGSVAILLPKDGIKISEKDLDYFGTDEFSKFYSIARNLGTRSLNIDNNSVFYFGKKQ